MVLALGLSLPAVAGFEVVSKAHEVSLADLRLPGSTSGTLTFKACEQCDYKTIRVTAATQYQVNRRSVGLEDFRKQLGNITNRRETTVTVLHHLESDTIKAIRVRY
jgi:biopolymer transport protein ExbD